MWRKVTQSRNYYFKGAAYGAFRIASTLECGHIVHTKGAKGVATKRKCIECDFLKEGMVRTTGNVRESWNAKTGMPLIEKIK